ncbi:hypothetical protein FJZ26_02555 [Candidatus Parvarchaeota archaeon]|nr:hypothetical protein [Candidatus Parvarchaeota archaeon]
MTALLVMRGCSKNRWLDWMWAGLIKKLFLQIRENLLLVPEKNFRQQHGEGRYFWQLAYMIFCLVLSMPINAYITYVGYEQGFIGAGPNWFAALGPQAKVFVAIVSTVIGLGVGIALFWFIAFIVHLAIKRLGGTEGFESTMLVFVTSNTGNFIFSRIPLVGMAFSLLALYNCVQGMKQVHGISTARAVAAVVVLPIALLGLFLVFFGGLVLSRAI